MKRIIYLVLKTTPESLHTLEEIRHEGYNATIMTTESLRHAIDDLPEESYFMSLRQVEKMTTNESFMCLFVIDEEKMDHLKEVIRKSTNCFKKIRGFMFSRPIEDYEGSI